MLFMLRASGGNEQCSAADASQKFHVLPALHDQKSCIGHQPRHALPLFDKTQPPPGIPRSRCPDAPANNSAPPRLHNRARSRPIVRPHNASTFCNSSLSQQLVERMIQFIAVHRY
jgi:hypothetical protein